MNNRHNMRSAIVLGAGMAGVATALHLQRRGWSVALVDRDAPGRATSYGNAGIIQSEAVEPYPMPRDLSALLAIASGRTNDVHYRVAALRHHLVPLLRYWWHSAPSRHGPIAESYATVIAQATAEHGPLIEAAGAQKLVRRDGYRALFRSERALDREMAAAEAARARHGVPFRALSPAELLAAEPSLKQAGAGALHWTSPWTVNDPGGLVAAYAELFRQEGGTISRGDATSLRADASGWTVRTADGPVDAEAAVMALGPWSPDALRPLGYRFPMVRKRGYHRHYRAPRSLDLPLRDAANGYVLVPMAAGTRITTGAELTGPDAPATPVQLGRAEAAAHDLVELGSPVESEPWMGTRPCMPDMLPVIGEAPRHPGLWLNFGHGHQGFTLGPATGRMLAELMSGEAPGVSAAPFSPARY